MGDVGQRGVDLGVTFWWENLRCLTLWVSAGLPPSGVAPACPRRARGVSKACLALVIPRNLGHCVPVRQAVTQAGQGVWQGSQGETRAGQVGLRGTHRPGKLHPWLTRLTYGYAEGATGPKVSSVAIKPTAEKQVTTSILALCLAALLLPVLVILWATESTEARTRRLSRSGWSQRRIAEHLGVTRYRVRLALA
jgi:hypothetical protein